MAIGKRTYGTAMLIAFPIIISHTALAATLHTDHASFSSEGVAIIEDFDSEVHGTLLSPVSSFTGFTLSARQIYTIDPTSFAPGLSVGGLNVNTAPNGVSASLSVSSSGSVSFDNGDDNFDIQFDDAVFGAGVWVGNLGAFNGDTSTTTTVSFFDASGSFLESVSLTQAYTGLIGSGVNNRAFVGLTDQLGIGMIEIRNAMQDGDGIIIDDVQFIVPAPGSIGVLGIVLIGCKRRRPPHQAW